MDVIIGNRIQETRKKLGMSQAELAEQLGIAKTTLSGYENAKREPDVATIKKLVAVLGVSGNFLLGVDDGIRNECVILNDMEHLLLRCFNSVNAEGQRAILKMAQAYADDVEYQKDIESAM